MHIVFLGARLPLTKSFVYRAGTFAAAPYPQVARVTSYHEEVRDLLGFTAQLTEHAAKGHCLFNGHLAHPLEGESRAGKTVKKPREWVVFDFDKVEGKDAEDVIRRYLPACCQNVSYVVQLSASMFRPDTKLWSGHIFMLLKELMDERQLFQWFEWVNFNVPALHDQVRLSDSLMALHWPLDRTVAYSSKLIYIAPPRCVGFEPAVDQHIKLVKKKQPNLSIPQFVEVSRGAIRDKINALRVAEGLDALAYETTIFEGEELLKNAGVVEVHDVKTSGDHYIRFNLNGGDSYAYFIDLRNPSIIRNFKGEPNLRTEEAAPELYKALTKVARRVVQRPPLDEGTEVLAFYATNRGSQIKIGAYSPVARTLRLDDSSESAARAWLTEHGLVQKAPFSHFDIVFDPKRDDQYIPGDIVVNLFKATDFMTKKPAIKAPSSVREIPKTIDRLMRSMLGDPTDVVYGQWMNWLSYIFQTRQKTGTAWVMSGVEGTGKGSFVRYVLTPLFGADVVRSVQFTALKKEFNGFLETALFVVFEEADIHAVDSVAELDAKLKHYITDSPLEIRTMRSDHRSVPNYTNFLFFSNTLTPVKASATNRRMNFAERQLQRLFFTPNEMLCLQNGDELEQFAEVLHRWPVDATAITRVVETKAAEDVHEATTSINQLIAEAVNKGDLQFFIDRMPTETESAADFYNRFNPLGMFKSLLEKYTKAAQENGEVLVTEEDLFTLFRTLISDDRFFQDSKTWRKRHYKSLGLEVDKQVRVPGEWNKRARGMLVRWQLPSEPVPA
jgi:hypothetical protein